MSKHKTGAKSPSRGYKIASSIYWGGLLVVWGFFFWLSIASYLKTENAFNSLMTLVYGALAVFAIYMVSTYGRNAGNFPFYERLYDELDELRDEIRDQSERRAK